jgi:hypothetical protein
MFNRNRNQAKCHSIFCTNREFVPAKVVEEIDDHGEVHEVLKQIKKEKKSKYLPGQRLLLKLNKEQMPPSNLSMKSIQNVMKMFT